MQQVLIPNVGWFLRVCYRGLKGASERVEYLRMPPAAGQITPFPKSK
ncbi:MAG TPA: hypothetical protein VGG64_28765 [Pirellulales bacterium]|jgi:hypothetical protein